MGNNTVAPGIATTTRISDRFDPKVKRKQPEAACRHLPLFEAFNEATS